MVLKRKPSKKQKKGVASFIDSASVKTSNLKRDIKLGKKIISISLSNSEANWLDETVKKLNSRTARKVTRTEVIVVAMDHLKVNSIENIMQLIQTR